MSKQNPPTSYRPQNPLTPQLLHILARRNGVNRNKFIDLAVEEKIRREFKFMKRDGVEYENKRIIRQAKTKVKLLKILQGLKPE